MTVTVRSIDVENEATVGSVRSNLFTSVPFEWYIIKNLLVVGRKNYEIKKHYMVRLNLRNDSKYVSLCHSEQKPNF